MKFIYIIVVLAVLALTAFSQPPKETASAVEDVYLARDDGNGKAGEVVESFSTKDIPIYVIVMLSGSDPVAVKMNLVAVKVNGVKPETKVVTTAYTTKQGQNRVYFTGRPEGTWTAGSYRIDVFVDGKREKSLAFEMKGFSTPAAAAPFAPAKPKASPRKTNPQR